ncbi:DUF3089 domain-containing protein [Panacibacter ginsenosidivorans]|uniref:DUF3089 domain-containing protein n=1 Tax=Panacibacter ginsenosidivorans TaxID=1813871 RepID=A0A5B8VA54_9BACT|nr:DUF3089 domain-containing protein [Panacibacter ginsenosidivorans]QEC68377.1 DUF3089 domain-containing protein [Panacibacter ginsenosidivorans]
MQKMLLSIFIIVAASCASNKNISYTNYDFKSPNGVPDYSNLDYWAAHPWKKDPSDSLPKALQKNYTTDSIVDIFFLHPTTFGDKTMKRGWNAGIDDSAINHKTDFTTILYQASIFNTAGRVFAPRYRQANYFAYFPTDTAKAIAAFDTAYDDVKAAFEYYLAHYNNGRPFIIASHSQGTTHAKRLIKEYIEGKPLQNRMVVAYLAGMPVEPDYFYNIPVCTNPNQTGCICSWRTFREGHTDSFIDKEKFTAIVTNPLTWDSSKTSAGRFENKGAVLQKFNKLKPNVAGAAVHNGVLWTNRPHFFGSIFLKNPNYHIADYNLYYLSVRENAQQRINAFWKR